MFILLCTHVYIVFVCKCHFSKEKEPFVRSLWGGECIFNNNNSQSHGVTILFSNNFSYKVHTYYRYDNDNLLIIDITIRYFRFTLINLYRPNSDQPDFYSFIIDKIKEFGNTFYLIAGDFNLILQQSLNSYNY